MTTDAAGEAFILRTLDDPKMQRKFARAGHPGWPISDLPMGCHVAFRSLRARGVVEVVTVTKPSKVTPGTTMDYAYIRRVAEGGVAR